MKTNSIHNYQLVIENVRGQKNGFKINKCKHCDVKTWSKKELDLHKVVHHEAKETNFKCKKCHTTFKSKTDLTVHDIECHETHMTDKLIPVNRQNNSYIC